MHKFPRTIMAALKFPFTLRYGQHERGEYETPRIVKQRRGLGGNYSRPTRMDIHCSSEEAAIHLKYIQCMRVIMSMIKGKPDPRYI